MLINSLPARFWDKVIVGSDDECWPWIANKCGGYGHFRYDGKVKKAHRLAYENRWGSIPDGLIVMHICDNRACVNVAHLRLGTLFDNNRDRDQKGRQVALKGTAHGMAKTNEEGILRIRALQDKQKKERAALAAELGVSEPTIADVMKGRTWHWLK